VLGAADGVELPGRAGALLPDPGRAGAGPVEPGRGGVPPGLPGPVDGGGGGFVSPPFPRFLTFFSFSGFEFSFLTTSARRVTSRHIPALVVTPLKTSLNWFGFARLFLLKTTSVPGIGVDFSNFKRSESVT
jgi:hypothetical protein